MPELAILIPTVGRAEMLPALLDNIHEATETAHAVYFVLELDDDESQAAVEGTSSVRMVGSFGSCAKAMNAGYRASCETYVFTGNDDLLFEPGWDTEAIAALQEPGKHVCGTNDGNGRMTCFTMVRRSYIVEQSGVFDRENTLYHEYTSQYVDTEFADYAKARGVWTEAERSITRHMHHEFGLASPDHPNYIKARETCAADYAEYLKRRPVWLAAATA